MLQLKKRSEYLDTPRVTVEVVFVQCLVFDILCISFFLTLLKHPSKPSVFGGVRVT